MSEGTQFPTEMVDLPSLGKVYPENSPLSSGKVEIKYMTAKEEDILTSENLIKKGVVLENKACVALEEDVCIFRRGNMFCLGRPDSL